MSIALHLLLDPADARLHEKNDGVGLANAPTGDAEPPVSYCTSEQADLLRQVIAEVDRASRRSHHTTVPHERRC
jgi:hypothetical protein